jgi:hypothetical protein
LAKFDLTLIDSVGTVLNQRTDHAEIAYFTGARNLLRNISAFAIAKK